MSASTLRLVTDLGPDGEVDDLSRRLGLALGACLTTGDAIAAGVDPQRLAEAMTEVARARGRVQLTAWGVAGGLGDMESVAQRLAEVTVIDAATTVGPIVSLGRAVVRLVAPTRGGRLRPPGKSIRERHRVRPRMVMTVAPETRAWLQARSAETGAAVGVVVDELVEAERSKKS